MSMTESERSALIERWTAKSSDAEKGLLHDRVTGWVTQPEWLAWS